MSSEAHPEYNASINRIAADMKDAEAKATRGDAAGAAAAASSLINDVFAAQFRFPNNPDYMKTLNQELVNQKLLPPGFELSGTTHTDHGNILKMKDKQSGNSFWVGHDDIQRIIPKQ